MARVLVTGGTGFVGMPTLQALVESGEEVHALSTSAAPPEVAGVTWHQGDLGVQGGVDQLLRDLSPERLVHLAWYVEHGRFWQAPENVEWVERSLGLLRRFVDAGGRRAVLLGTCAEYDWSAAEGPLNETDTPLGPTTLYGVAKDSLHRVCATYAGNVGLELAWGRLFFLYGPREAPGRLVSSVARSLLAGERVDTTEGSQIRDFLHVGDVGGALAALAGSSVVGPVNIASGEPITIAAVIDRIAAATGRADLLNRGALPGRPDDPTSLVADVSRLRDEVGFTPGISMDAGIAATVEWWRAQGPT